MNTYTSGSRSTVPDHEVEELSALSSRVWLRSYRRYCSRTEPAIHFRAVEFVIGMDLTELHGTIDHEHVLFDTVLTKLDCVAAHYFSEIFLALVRSASCLSSCILVLFLFVVGGLMMRPNCFCKGDSPCCLSWISFRTEDTTAVHC